MSRENALLKSLPAGIAVPRDRGRLLFPEDIKEKYFKPRHTIAWIKRRGTWRTKLLQEHARGIGNLRERRHDLQRFSHRS